jgi:glutathione reductase (NADPH)
LKNYDLAVIGGGSGGVRAARIAASLGATVVLAEESRIGGTCVIRGCVPKKLLVYASRVGTDAEDGRGFGWLNEARGFSWPALMVNIDTEVARLEARYTATLTSAGVQIAHSRAELLGDGRISLCSENEVIRAKHILIATGARPIADASFPGWELCQTSDDIFTWRSLPRRVVIQGAGYIALEFACLLAKLGTDVTIVCRGSYVLRGFDCDIRRHVQAELQAANVKIASNRTLLAVRRADTNLVAQLSDGSLLSTDAVIRAVGRQPNTRGLGLEQAGVLTDARQAIVVDEAFETTAPGVFAVGDVTNPVQLTPIAIRDGHSFAQMVFGGAKGLRQMSVVPTAVFTTPEVGTVGLSEDEAIASNRTVDIFVSEFKPMKAALSGRNSKCLFKLIVNRIDDRILGAHLVGPEAAEMIQLLGVTLTMGVTKTVLDRTLPVHPTLAEELITMHQPLRRHALSEAA